MPTQYCSIPRVRTSRVAAFLYSDGVEEDRRTWTPTSISPTQRRSHRKSVDVSGATDGCALPLKSGRGAVGARTLRQERNCSRSARSGVAEVSRLVHTYNQEIFAQIGNLLISRQWLAQSRQVRAHNSIRSSSFIASHACAQASQSCAQAVQTAACCGERRNSELAVFSHISAQSANSVICASMTCMPPFSRQ